MTNDQARQFGWDAAAALIGFLGVVALVLLAFALMRELSR